MNTIGVITVRLSSTRLPRKALLKIEDKSFLSHLIERVSLSRMLDKLVIATTNNPVDKEIVKLAHKNDWNIFQGDEFNLLKRLIAVGEKYKALQIVRITADNIFTDPQNIDELVVSHIETAADYSVTAKLPLGVTAEVINLTSLEHLNKIKGKDPEVREHVTSFIQKHSELFKLNIKIAPTQFRFPNLRLTCDYKQDVYVIRAIFRSLYSTAKKNNRIISLSEIITYLNSHPEISRINSHIIHPGADFQK